MKTGELDNQVIANHAFDMDTLTDQEREYIVNDVLVIEETIAQLRVEGRNTTAERAT